MNIKGLFIAILLSLWIIPGFSQSCQNCGFGTNTPQARLEVRGCTDDSTTAAFKATNSVDTTNGYPLLYVRDDKRVGINTKYPKNVLDVRSLGTGGINIINTNASTLPSLNFFVNTTSTSNFSLGVDGSDGNKFKIGTSALGSNTRFSIDGSGYIGIATSSPISLFQVGSTSHASNTVYEQTFSSGNQSSIFNGTAVRFTGNTVSYAGIKSESSIYCAAGTTLTDYYGIANTYQGGINNAGTVTNSYGLYIKTPLIGTNKYTAYFEGTVGIGTASPVYKLDVQTTASTKAAYFQTTGSWQAIDFSSDGGTTKGSLSAVSGYLNLGSAGSGTNTNMAIHLSTGKVGVNTATPGAQLHVHEVVSGGGQMFLTQNRSGSANSSANGDGSYVSFRQQVSGSFQTNSMIGGVTDLTTADGGRLEFYTKPTSGSLTERMRIDKTGSVGIGTTAPGTLLEVSKQQAALTAIRVRNDDLATAGTKVGFEAYSKEVASGIDRRAFRIYADKVQWTNTWGVGIQANLYLDVMDTRSNSANYGTIQFRGVDASENIANWVTFKNGQVGIGATAPEDLLEVQGAEATNATVVLDADDGDDNADTWSLKSEASTNDFSLTNHTTKYLALTSDGRLYGSALHNNAGAVTGTTNQYIASGTYTPTLTNVTNIAASTAYACQWMRVGNVVTVTGKVDIDPTSSGTTTLRISLPIASALAAGNQCAGAANASAGDNGAILGDATNDAAYLWAKVTETANGDWYFTFTYTVL